MKNICVYTLVRFWLDVQKVTIEATSIKSLPGIEIVWLPWTAIKEATSRIKAACKNLAITWSPQKIVINLSPGDIRKNWSYFDLPIFMSLYVLVSEIDTFWLWFIKQSLFFWEIWLDWSIKKVQWLLPMILWAKKLWWKTFVIPEANSDELLVVWDVTIYVVSDIQDIVKYFNKKWSLKKLQKKAINYQKKSFYDQIQWHNFAKRALKIAACWQHNILLFWAPWTWKTLLATYLKDLLPPLSKEKCVDVWKIHSLLWKETYTNERPFVHVTNWTTKTTLLWWWRNLLPWLLSQAHRWVLFLDEICEFSGDIIDSLRQSMQEKKVRIKRANWSVEYPANCLIVWAMNPCRCWFYNTKQWICNCSDSAIRSYQSKISWPIRDRFDMIIEVKKQPIETTLCITKTKISSKDIVSTRKKQTKRNNWTLNWSTNIRTIIGDWLITSKAEKFLITVTKKQKLSTRVSHKIIMIARTIADLDASEKIELRHISEAIQYRSLSLFIDL